MNQQGPGSGQQPYGPPPGQPGYGPPPRKKGGAGKVLVLLVVLLALGGGGYFVYRTFFATPAPTDPVAAPAAPTPDRAEDAGPLPGEPQAPVEDCPFTADQMTAMLGRPMTESGACVFGDGQVGQIAIEVRSASSTRASYAARRSQAQSRYQSVRDVENGDEGFVALSDTGAEAVVLGPRTGYSVTMRGFTGFGGDGTYEQPMRNVTGALPR